MILNILQYYVSITPVRKLLDVLCFTINDFIQKLNVTRNKAISLKQPSLLEVELKGKLSILVRLSN